MKAFLFKVTLISGLSFAASGIGYNIDQALMDACDTLAQIGEYPEDEIEKIELSPIGEKLS
jgi:hypothetical protein